MPWAYFHPITTLDIRRDGSWKELPIIDLPPKILADLKKPWESIRLKEDYEPPPPCFQKRGYYGQSTPTPILAQPKTLALLPLPLPPEKYDPNQPNDKPRENEGKGGQGEGQSEKERACYRFLCFIHTHTLSLRPGSRRAIYTISIWDREWDELTWHDTYWEGRAARRLNVRLFWRHAADMPGGGGLSFLNNNARNRRGGGDVGGPGAAFEKKIRFRTPYHAASKLGDALREYPNPRHTLWAVIGVAMHHMNRGAVDPHVGVVPDRLEFFGGCEGNLLPRLWTHLFCLLLVIKGGWVQEGNGEGGKGNDGGDEEARREELVKFVEQFWIVERLGWMRKMASKHLAKRLAKEDVGWVFEALRLPEIPLSRVSVAFGLGGSGNKKKKGKEREKGDVGESEKGKEEVVCVWSGPVMVD